MQKTDCLPLNLVFTIFYLKFNKFLQSGIRRNPAFFLLTSESTILLVQYPWMMNRWMLLKNKFQLHTKPLCGNIFV